MAVAYKYRLNVSDGVDERLNLGGFLELVSPVCDGLFEQSGKYLFVSNEPADSLDIMMRVNSVIKETAYYSLGEHTIKLPVSKLELFFREIPPALYMKISNQTTLNQENTNNYEPTKTNSTQTSP